jgi:hypothetical protein
MVAALTKESLFTLIVAGASEGGRCFVSGLASLADDLCDDEARGEGRSFISLHFLLKLRNALSRSPLLFRLSLSLDARAHQRCSAARQSALLLLLLLLPRREQQLCCRRHIA